MFGLVINLDNDLVSSTILTTSLTILESIACDYILLDFVQIINISLFLLVTIRS